MKEKNLKIRTFALLILFFLTQQKYGNQRQSIIKTI
jgi:hypothetical protein